MNTSGWGMLPFRTVTIVGVGLMGGSIGLALRRRRLAHRVVGVGHRRASIDRAVELGAVDEATLDVAEGVRDADLTILATPLGLMVPLAEAARGALSRGSVVTDVGSTKARLVHDLEALSDERFRYVGSHPMAGSEQRGVEKADAELFEGALCFLTPTPRSDPRVVEALTELWQRLGARVRLIDPAEHDRLVGLASHLPHLVAAALVNATTAEAWSCVGSGFRDTTRVASGDPRLWADVCLQNQERILDALVALDRQVETLRDILRRRSETELLAWLESAKALRDHHMDSRRSGSR